MRKKDTDQGKFFQQNSCRTPKEEKRFVISHKFEMNCGGGGGPKRQQTKTVSHIYEMNCGGGGGPKRQQTKTVAHL